MWLPDNGRRVAEGCSEKYLLVKGYGKLQCHGMFSYFTHWASMSSQGGEVVLGVRVLAGSGRDKPPSRDVKVPKKGKKTIVKIL